MPLPRAQNFLRVVLPIREGKGELERRVSVLAFFSPELPVGEATLRLLAALKLNW